MEETRNRTSSIEKISSITKNLKLQFELLKNEDQQLAAEFISHLHTVCLSESVQSVNNDTVTSHQPFTHSESGNAIHVAYDKSDVKTAHTVNHVSVSTPTLDSDVTLKKSQLNEKCTLLKPDWLLLQKLEQIKNENKVLKSQLWKNNIQSSVKSSLANNVDPVNNEAAAFANEYLNELITKTVFLAETQTSSAQLSRYLNTPWPKQKCRGRPPKKRTPVTNGMAQYPSQKSKLNTNLSISNQNFNYEKECTKQQKNKIDLLESYSKRNTKEAENLPPRKQKLLAKSRVSTRQQNSTLDESNQRGDSDLSGLDTEIQDHSPDPNWSIQCSKRKRGRPRKHPAPLTGFVRGKHRIIIRHKCLICEATFTHGRPFKRHLSSYPRGGCSCRLCKKEFISQAIFLHHDCNARRKTKGTLKICKHCGKQFTNTKKFSAHLKQEHNDRLGDPGCFCKFCNKGFIKRTTMYKHYLEHTEPGKTVCNRCGDMLSDTEEATNKHNQYHLEQANHVCDKCGATFIRRQQYEQHMVAHSKYDCLMCDAYFSTRKALEKHQRVLHGIRTDYDTKKFYCDRCGRCFARPGLLEIHTRIHTGVKPIECNVCHLYFRTPKALNKHRQTYTHMARAGDIQKERDHLCQVCGKAYYRKQALQRHMRYHTGEKPYKCPHCDYVCRENNNLKRHIALHFSQRDYVCETCGAAFHAKKTLETHRVYKHSEARSFHCEECPMSFKTPNSLRRHMRIHSNTRPHKCAWCGTGFNRLYNLRRHLRSVHGNDEGIPPPKRVKLLDVPMGLEYHKGSVAAATGLSPPEAPSISKKKSRRGKGRPGQSHPELKESVELLANPALFSGMEEAAGVRQEGVAILITPPVTRTDQPHTEPILNAVQAPAASALNPQVINQIVTNTVSMMHGYYQDADGNVRGYTLAPPVNEPCNRNITASALENNVISQPTVHIAERTDFQQDVYGAIPNFLHYMQGNS